MISSTTINEVLDRTNLLDIVQENVSMKRVGKEYVGCCPFHNEKTGSFHVDPVKNMWFCHGACHDGGGLVDYVMKFYNCSYPEAIKELAKRCGVTVEEENNKSFSEEEKRAALHKESLQCALHEMQDFFVHNFNDDNAEARAARAYAFDRWGEEFCHKHGIGYAYDAWGKVEEYAKSRGIGIAYLAELGLVSYNESRKSYFDFFRGRIMIPIKDKTQRIIGYTARDVMGKKVHGEKPAKYLNSKESVLFQKKKTLFGIDVATRSASKDDKFFCVEGGPDVLRMQTIDVNNTVAPLGGNWTEDQFKLIKKYSQNLCFMPDADPVREGEKFGAGTVTVMKYGMMATKLGFAVSVKEIPLTDLGEKNDPDSFVTSRDILDSLTETDFLVWYARKAFATKETSEERTVIINTISQQIAAMNDSVKESMTIDQLSKIHGSKSLWKNAINAAKKKIKDDELAASGNNVNLDILQKYGFHQNRNSYISIGKDGNEFQWSNFIMRPLYHIEDAVKPVRIYELTNEQNVKKVVEMNMDELVSLAMFKKKVEGLGNYIWMAKEEQLTKLKRFLYETTETAVRIEQMGWQRQGFFAFGNGIYSTEFNKADDLGIVRLDGIGNFYLPAMSKVFKDKDELYQFERNFVHTEYSSISLFDYCSKLINVFGDNAKVGIAFLLATLFRDVVTSITKSFPILNLFGPKGSGKSELGHSLMSFFIIDNTPPNINNSTVPALSYAVAQCANALVHLDEFKNDIDIIKREFLKGLWDGAGRNRMSQKYDDKREVTRVCCGVMVSGQEMATADIALFSRLIFLSYSKSEFSREAKEAFEDLRTTRKRGCSHLTLQILKYRKRFEQEFKGYYNLCLTDLVDALGDAGIEDRILRNWLIPLAAYRTLEAPLQLPFDYMNLLNICIDGIKRQNSEVKQNNELADWWNFVAFLHQDGKIWSTADFHLKYVQNFSTTLFENVQYKEQKPILILRTKRLLELYSASAKHGEPRLPKGSLLYYLEHSPAFLGYKASVRWNVIINGLEQIKIETVNGRTRQRKIQNIDKGMCFDYEALTNTFGISLETVTLDD